MGKVIYRKGPQPSKFEEFNGSKAEVKETASPIPTTKPPLKKKK
tara:strand:- start:236 stop:367 length:132 start_codon:yes stop_codon:yes gene_type:complete